MATTTRRIRSACDSNTVEGWVLQQDLLLQSPKRWAWLEAELFDERFTNTRVCTQRVGLAATAVERGDE